VPNKALAPAAVTPGSRYFDLEVLLLCTVFTVPSSFQITSPAIAIGDFYITAVEVCVAALGARWACGALVRRNATRVDHSFRWPMSAVLIVFAVSAILGLVRHGPVMALGDARQFLPLGLYFAAMRSAARPEQLAAIRNALFGVLLVVAVYVLIAFIFFRSALTVYSLDGTRVLDDRVLFDNTLFLFLLYGGYLLSHAICSQRRRFFFTLVVAANLLMLLVMQVRTYWVAAGLVLASAAWSQRHRLLRPRIVALSALVLPALVAALLASTLMETDDEEWGSVKTSMTERAQSLLNFRETFIDKSAKTTNDVETLGTRWETAKAVTTDYILPNPLLGVGFGTELPMVNGAGATVWSSFHIDNGYLTILAKCGIIGFVLCGAVLLRVVAGLRRVVRSRIATPHERMLARSFLGGIVAALLASVFSSILVRQQASIIAFLLLIAESIALSRSVRFRTDAGRHSVAEYMTAPM
jgi:hypothetical protein